MLSQRFERRTFATPFEVYRALRVVNPSPYMVYMQVGGGGGREGGRGFRVLGVGGSELEIGGRWGVRDVHMQVVCVCVCGMRSVRAGQGRRMCMCVGGSAAVVLCRIKSHAALTCTPPVHVRALTPAPTHAPCAA